VGNVVIERLEVAAGHGIGSFLEADRTAILTAFDGWSDDAINKFVTDFADNLPSGGIKSMEFGTFERALKSSEPAFDSTANGKVAEAFDAVATALTNLSAGPTT
jgi:hypothetical protein